MTTNKKLWLDFLLEKGEVRFEDIVAVMKNPEKFEFKYTATSEHALFHEILADLDSLCKEGLAYRTFEKDESGEIVEKFKIIVKYDEN